MGNKQESTSLEKLQGNDAIKRAELQNVAYREWALDKAKELISLLIKPLIDVSANMVLSLQKGQIMKPVERLNKLVQEEREKISAFAKVAEKARLQEERLRLAYQNAKAKNNKAQAAAQRVSVESTDLIKDIEKRKQELLNNTDLSWNQAVERCFDQLEEKTHDQQKRDLEILALVYEECAIWGVSMNQLEVNWGTNNSENTKKVEVNSQVLEADDFEVLQAMYGEAALFGANLDQYRGNQLPPLGNNGKKNEAVDSTKTGNANAPDIVVDLSGLTNILNDTSLVRRTNVSDHQRSNKPNVSDHQHSNKPKGGGLKIS